MDGYSEETAPYEPEPAGAPQYSPAVLNAYAPGGPPGGGGQEGGGQKSNPGEITTLFITGVTIDVTHREMYLLFSRYRGYVGCRLQGSGPTKPPVVFAQYETRDSCEAAIAGLSGFCFDPESNQQLRIEMAKSNSRVTSVTGGGKRGRDEGSYGGGGRGPKSLRYGDGMPDMGGYGGGGYGSGPMPPQGGFGGYGAPPILPGVGGGAGYGGDGGGYGMPQGGGYGGDQFGGPPQGGGYGGFQQGPPPGQGMPPGGPGMGGDGGMGGGYGGGMDGGGGYRGMPPGGPGMGGGFGAPPAPPGGPGPVGMGGYGDGPPGGPGGGPGRGSTPCETLFVANLSQQASEGELQELFGRLDGFVKMRFSPMSGRSPVAWIDFSDVVSSTGAMQRMQGTKLAGCESGMRIEFAKSKMGTRPGGGGGGGYGGRGGGRPRY